MSSYVDDIDYLLKLQKSLNWDLGGIKVYNLGFSPKGQREVFMCNTGSWSNRHKKRSCIHMVEEERAQQNAMYMYM